MSEVEGEKLNEKKTERKIGNGKRKMEKWS